MKRKMIHQTTKKILTGTAKTLLFLIEKLDDLNFSITYPSLFAKLGVRSGRAYLNFIHQKKPYIIHRLKKNGWITLRKIGAEVEMKLTTNGRVATLQLIISQQTKVLPDHKILLVAFDIPEAARNVRLLFKNSLKRMGFRYEQRSLWSTHRSVTDELNEYIRLLDIKKWVTIFYAKKIL